MDTHEPTLHSDRLHPRVWATIVGLTLWLVVSAWLFFSTGAYASVVLAVVTGFFIMAVGLTLILSRVGRSGQRHHAARFHDWELGEFDTWQSHLGGREAALQVLLPIAAAALGMTLIGLAFTFATP
jgi:uncharacterized membrane protein HdeD (DUF308 family)